MTAHPNRALVAKDMLPYYARPGFDWNDKSKWINDQNAVNYWLAHKRMNTNNPDSEDYTSKTY